MSSTNPFSMSDEDTGNPFADPSISTAISSNAYVPNAPPAAHQSPTASVPATSYPPNNATKHDSATHLSDFAAKEAELRRREEELAMREARVNQQQEEIRRAGFKPPNFPPFYPYIYHDINDEIPDGLARRTMWKLYYYWLATLGLLVFNMIACLAMMVSHPQGMTNVASDFGVSFVYIFTIGLGSFFLWYRPVYQAYQKESSFWFYIYMVFAGIHCFFSAYMAVGIPGSGASGFINFLATATGGAVVAGVFTAIGFVGWVAEAFFGFWMWKLVNDHFRAAGHTFESARNEAVTIGVRSGVGQTVAQEAVRQNYMRSNDGNFSRA
ncbi:scamp family-domain-containing protein [Cladochytrium replicatum]|nr:scamp family-domain-containing protein [Cladochytrium replicatum]